MVVREWDTQGDTTGKGRQAGREQVRKISRDIGRTGREGQAETGIGGTQVGKKKQR